MIPEVIFLLFNKVFSNILGAHHLDCVPFKLELSQDLLEISRELTNVYHSFPVKMCVWVKSIIFGSILDPFVMLRQKRMTRREGR